MLDPGNRAAFTEELTPPPGFALHHAVGTTFTLDLDAALAVPLALTRFSDDDASTGEPRAPEDGDAQPDRVSILAALLGVSERIDIFTQAGAMSVDRPSELFELLGPMIHQGALPRGGIIHPKVWFLSFTNIDGERRWRLLCSSRNLTFDRSWDAMIRLEGEPAPQDRVPEARERNAPLVALLRYLQHPDVLTGRLPDARRQKLARFAEELAEVQWETSRPVKDLRFHALGVPDQPAPQLMGTRALIVSPFLTADGLYALTRKVRGETDVVSRPEAFDALGDTAFTGMRTWTVDSAAEAQEDAPTGLTGLHAKILAYQTTSTRSRLLIGSANTTGPAFAALTGAGAGNVELMVEVLAAATNNPYAPAAVQESMQALLQPHTPAPEPTEEDPQTEELDRLQRALLQLAARPLTIEVTEENPAGGEETSYQLRVTSTDVTVPAQIRRLRWHLLPDESLGAEHLPTSEDPLILSGVALRSISPFVRISAEDTAGNRVQAVLMGTLIGDPPQRRESIIASRLADPQRLMQLIVLLLDFTPGAAGASWATGVGESVSHPDGGRHFPGLLEALLRALNHGAEGMAEVHRVLETLRRSPEGDSLPHDFLTLWDAAWQAHLQEEGIAG